MLPMVFRASARFEFDAAGDWYEARRPGLGPRFAATVQSVLDRIASQPDFYAVAMNEVREASVPGFPYCIYYREEPGQIVILAVFHASRDPTIWQARE